MKKIISLLILTVFAFALNAQTTTAEPATRSVYIELGGPSVIYSLNYDFMFNRASTTGWGARVGAGASAGGDFNFVSIPLMVNYLLGKHNNFFELSAGPVINFGDEMLYIDPEVAPVFGSIYIGYRLQPADQGFLFRAGVPIHFGVNEEFDWETNETVNQFYILPFYPGVSFGYAF